MFGRRAAAGGAASNSSSVTGGGGGGASNRVVDPLAAFLDDDDIMAKARDENKRRHSPIKTPTPTPQPAATAITAAAAKPKVPSAMSWLEDEDDDDVRGGAVDTASAASSMAPNLNLMPSAVVSQQQRPNVTASPALSLGGGLGGRPTSTTTNATANPMTASSGELAQNQNQTAAFINPLPTTTARSAATSAVTFESSSTTTTIMSNTQNASLHHHNASGGGDGGAVVEVSSISATSHSKATTATSLGGGGGASSGVAPFIASPSSGSAFSRDQQQPQQHTVASSATTATTGEGFAPSSAPSSSFASLAEEAAALEINLTQLNTSIVERQAIVAALQKSVAVALGGGGVSGEGTTPTTTNSNSDGNNNNNGNVSALDATAAPNSNTTANAANHTMNGGGGGGLAAAAEAGAFERRRRAEEARILQAQAHRERMAAIYQRTQDAIAAHHRNVAANVETAARQQIAELEKSIAEEKAAVEALEKQCAEASKATVDSALDAVFSPNADGSIVSADGGKNNLVTTAVNSLQQHMTKVIEGLRRDFQESAANTLSSQLIASVEALRDERLRSFSEDKLKRAEQFKMHIGARGRVLEGFQSQRFKARQNATDASLSDVKLHWEKFTLDTKVRAAAAAAEADSKISNELNKAKSEAQQALDRILAKHKGLLEDFERSARQREEEARARLAMEANHQSRLHESEKRSIELTYQYAADALKEAEAFNTNANNGGGGAKRNMFTSAAGQHAAVSMSTLASIEAAAIHAKRLVDEVDVATYEATTHSATEQSRKQIKEKEAIIDDLQTHIENQRETLMRDWVKVQQMLSSLTNDADHFSKSLSQGRSSLIAAQQYVDTTRTAWEKELLRTMGNCFAGGTEAIVHRGEDVTGQILFDLNCKMRDLLLKAEALMAVRREMETQVQQQDERVAGTREAEGQTVRKLLTLYEQIATTSNQIEQKQSTIALEKRDLLNAIESTQEERKRVTERSEDLEREMNAIRSEIENYGGIRTNAFTSSRQSSSSPLKQLTTNYNRHLAASRAAYEPARYSGPSSTSASGGGEGGGGRGSYSSGSGSSYYRTSSSPFSSAAEKEKDQPPSSQSQRAYHALLSGAAAGGSNSNPNNTQQYQSSATTASGTTTTSSSSGSSRRTATSLGGATTIPTLSLPRSSTSAGTTSLSSGQQQQNQNAMADNNNNNDSALLAADKYRHLYDASAFNSTAQTAAEFMSLIRVGGGGGDNTTLFGGGGNAVTNNSNVSAAQNNNSTALTTTVGIENTTSAVSASPSLSMLAGGNNNNGGWTHGGGGGGYDRQQSNVTHQTAVTDATSFGAGARSGENGGAEFSAFNFSNQQRGLSYLDSSSGTATSQQYRPHNNNNDVPPHHHHNMDHSSYATTALSFQDDEEATQQQPKYYQQQQQQSSAPPSSSSWEDRYRQTTRLTTTTSSSSAGGINKNNHDNRAGGTLPPPHLSSSSASTTTATAAAAAAARPLSADLYAASTIGESISQRGGEVGSGGGGGFGGGSRAYDQLLAAHQQQQRGMGKGAQSVASGTSSRGSGATLTTPTPSTSQEPYY